jgi:hypothetical protein
MDTSRTENASDLGDAVSEFDRRLDAFRRGELPQPAPQPGPVAAPEPLRSKAYKPHRKPFSSVPPVLPKSVRCRACKFRYQQKAGLCASCYREHSGEFARSDAEVRNAPEPTGGTRVVQVERPRREVTVDGVTYEVMFDGT